jgi:Tfp pilus assembly protein PilZ
MRERAVRVVPQKAITVAIDNPRRGRSYGVVANISAGGACLLTDARYPVGDSVDLELSFFRELQVVPAAGRIVWMSGSVEAGAVRYGLEWSAGFADVMLRSLIERAGSA